MSAPPQPPSADQMLRVEAVLRRCWDKVAFSASSSKKRPVPEGVDAEFACLVLSGCLTEFGVHWSSNSRDSRPVLSLV